MKKYFTHPTILKFYQTFNNINVIRGVRGSGKTIGCLMWFFIVAEKQNPDNRGIRHTRFAVIRDSYPNLDSSVIKTFKSWFGDLEFKNGPLEINKSHPRVCHIEYDLSDNTSVDMEINFFAMKDENSEKYLKSHEYTWVYMNELSSLNPVTIQLAKGCLRYPSINEGGITSSGIIADTNPPDKINWVYNYENTKNSNVNFYIQPPVFFQRIDANNNINYIKNYKAENLQNLEQPSNYKKLTLRERKDFGFNYYYKLIEGEDQNFINKNALNEYGDAFGGVGMFSESFNKYRDNIIIKTQPKNKSHEIIVGFDTSGFNPSCVFIQNIYKDTYVLDELEATNCPFSIFVNDVFFPFVNKNYLGYNLLLVVDPANARDTLYGESPIVTLRKKSFRVTIQGVTNNFDRGYETVIHFLNSRNFYIYEGCQNIIEGLSGGYTFPQIKVNGVFLPSKCANKKSKYSHSQDALKYGLMRISSFKKSNNIITTGKYNAVSSSW